MKEPESKDKDKITILTIVAIVAIVGIIAIVISYVGVNKPSLKLSDSSGAENLVGQADVSLKICVDSDDGLNYNVQGTTCAKGIPCSVDYCIDKILLNEFYCKKGVKPVQSVTYSCPYACANGACIPAPTNNPPEITVVGPVPSQLAPGQVAPFTWQATDPDGNGLAWGIDWGDKTQDPMPPCPPAGQGWTYSTSHSWNSSGTYIITATVNDCKGGYDINSFKIDVI